RIDAYLAAMQLDKRALQGQAEAGAAVPRPVRVALEPVEHLVLDVRRNARTGIGYGKHDGMLAPFCADADTRVLRREADGIGEQIIQHLHHAALVADKASDVGIDIDLEADA